MLRDQGRDLHSEFINLLPERPRPIRIQRWGARRVGLLLLMVPLAILLALSVQFVLVNNDRTLTPLRVDSLGCREMEPLWLEAQSVPSASLVPCVRLRGQPDGDSAAPTSGTAGRSSPSTTWSTPRSWSCG